VTREDPVTSRALVRQLVRNFPENGPKLLLENPANVRDLLVLLKEPAVPDIDFAAMTVERSHFVQADYQHVALDMLLKAPLRSPAEEPAENLYIYVLVEHQSKPQRFFQLRLMEYMIEAYKAQKRAWNEQHTSDADFLLDPVLPVVLYTGERSWPEAKPLAALVRAGRRFRRRIPRFQPHFLNLRNTTPEELTGRGGFFGQVLWLIRERHSDKATFQRTLEEVLTKLKGMPAAERTRWVRFLHYIAMLVYHARSDAEQQPLGEVIDRTVETNPRRQEYLKMTRTIAEAMMEEGKQKGEISARQETLLLLLRKRFKKLPRKVEARIAATTNLQDLKTWLGNVIDAATLADVGIPVD
jgi:hypothetical protein